MGRRSWAEVLGDARVRTAIASSAVVRRVEHHAVVDSTQDVARVAGDARGLLVVADAQRAGRGRHGRTWQDGPEVASSLAASVVLDDRPGPGVLTLAVGLAVHAAALAATDGRAALALRWPNDLVAVRSDGRDAKCAGVLVERVAVGGAHRLVVGIGVDVDWRGHAHDAAWTSLAEVAGAAIDRATLLVALVAGLDRWLDATDADVLRAHRARSASLGRVVTVTAADGTRRTGRAVDLDEDGALVVEVDGARTVVRSGTVDADQ